MAVLNNLAVVLTTTSIALLVMGLLSIFIGFHNIDTVFNIKEMAYINHAPYENYNDCNLYGCRSLNEWYKEGIYFIYEGIVLFLLSFLFLFFSRHLNSPP